MRCLLSLKIIKNTQMTISLSRVMGIEEFIDGMMQIWNFQIFMWSFQIFKQSKSRVYVVILCFQKHNVQYNKRSFAEITIC